MPRRASPKREREYEELKERFEQEGRETEVTSRIVNKQRAMYGETREDKKQVREGTDADRNLPIPHYRELTIPQVTSKLQNFSRKDLRQLASYEKKHKKRKGVLSAIERKDQRAA